MAVTTLFDDVLRQGGGDFGIVVEAHCAGGTSGGEGPQHGDISELLCQGERPSLASILPAFEKAGHAAARALDARILVARRQPPILDKLRDPLVWFPA